MAISDSQKVDYLFKKVGYNVAKTDTAVSKSPSNETIPSPLHVNGSSIWWQTTPEFIPQLPPSSSTSVIAVLKNTNRVQCVQDTTAALRRTWKTNLTDWIPPSYGPKYQITVYVDNVGAANPSATGIKLFPDGNGNNDSYLFDYQSGVLQFWDTNVPTSLTANKRIFVEGYQYIGIKGASINAEVLTILDLGSGPGQIPVNSDLGGLAYQDPETVDGVILRGGNFSGEIDWTEVIDQPGGEGLDLTTILTTAIVGTSPDQISLNKTLGGMAFQDPKTVTDMSIDGGNF